MKKGFTLIELLVAVLIIGILAAIALPQYQRAVEKSKASEAIIVMRAIINAQEIYRIATGNYTENIDDLDVTIQNTSKFDYICWFSQGVSCSGTPKDNADYRIEFHSVSGIVNAAAGGAKWCVAASERGKDICKSLGDGAVRYTSSNPNNKGIYYDIL